MTINIFILKGDLNGKTVVVRFFFLWGILTCSIPGVSMHFQSEGKTVWILIRWLRQKSADLDLQCFHKKKSWLSKTQVN